MTEEDPPQPQELNNTMTDDVTAALNEEIATLRKTVAAANQAVKSAVGSNNLLHERVKKAENISETWKKLALRPASQRQAWVTTFLLIGVGAVVGYVHHQAQLLRDVVEEHQCPVAVECPPVVVCEAPEVQPTQGADERGYWVEADGMGDWHPWPDSSGYPAARFEDDCRDVCEVPEGYGHDRQAGRVLVTDPEHLLCICFHPDSHGTAWAVARWIGWEHIR